MPSDVTFLMSFAVFGPSPLKLDKLQFLVFIFAALLPDLCSVSLCNYRIYLSSFFDSQDCGCTTILSKIKTVTLGQVLRTNMHHSAKFYQNRSIGCRDMAI